MLRGPTARARALVLEDEIATPLVVGVPRRDVRRGGDAHHRPRPQVHQLLPGLRKHLPHALLCFGITVATLGLFVISGCKTTDFSDVEYRNMQRMVYGTKLADAASTHYALTVCKTCSESNPMVRPFAEQPAGFYAVKLGIGWLVLRHANAQRKAHNPYWRIIPMVHVGIDGVVAVWNLNIALGGNNR